MNGQIQQLIRERGVLLEKRLFDLLGQFQSFEEAKLFLERLEHVCGQKIITSSTLARKPELVNQLLLEISPSLQKSASDAFSAMGIVIKNTHISHTAFSNPSVKSATAITYEIVAPNTASTSKIGVEDFVGHFRSRYQALQRILMHRSGMANLVSINKLSGNRQAVMVIGIVTEKRITPNKNLIIKFEDLTGSVSGLIKADSEIYSKAAELQLDDIVAVKASGNQEILFVHDIIFPDSVVSEKTHFSEDSVIAFLSDVHAGSIKHLGAELSSFFDWLNGGSELAKKIKFIFFVGDNVDGVGVFPGQERVLSLKSLKEQYLLLASYLKRVPEHITMFMCPGQHDSVRVAEPQPIIDNFYGAPLYEIPNLILVPNPTLIKLKEAHKEFKVLMYHGASIHSFINEIEELRVMKAHRCPAKAVRHMLKRRHLAPTHSEVSYIPNANADPLVISEVPDVLCTGEVHRLDIENYNGTLIMTGSCWQSQTDFEEKVGNVPDPCKVPLLNLKTRELKILDFSGGEEQE